MAWRHPGVFLLLILSLPAATASPIEAEIATSRTMAVHPPVAINADLAAGFVNDATTWQAARLQCTRLVVDHWEVTTLRTGTLEIPIRQSSPKYTLNDAKVQFTESEASGWIGIYPTPAVATLTSSAGAAIDVAAEATIGNAPATPESAPSPSVPSFAWRQTEPVLHTRLEGTLAMRGTFVLKLSGILVDIQARENATQIDTRPPPPASPAQNERRWLTLECAGELQTTPRAVTEILTMRLRATATRLSLDEASGSTQIGGILTQLNGEPFDAEGELQVDIVPTDIQGQAAAVLQVKGDARTSTAQIPARVTTRDALPWIIGLVLGLAAGGTGTLLYLKRGRPATEPLTLEQCTDLYLQASEAEDHALALEWNTRAIAIAGEHPRLLTDRAFFLSRLGDVDEALRTYQRASELSSEGEADLLRAQLLAEIGQRDEAAEALAHALDKDPLILLEIEDAPWAQNIASPAVEAALRRARRRVDET